MTVVTEWPVTALLHYQHFCCYIIGCYIIDKFRTYIIGPILLHFRAILLHLSFSCYIIGWRYIIGRCYFIGHNRACKLGLQLKRNEETLFTW